MVSKKEMVTYYNTHVLGLARSCREVYETRWFPTKTSIVIVRNCLAPMRYFVHDTPRHVRHDSVGMYNEERMAYSAAYSTSMFFRQNTYRYMFFCFTSSDILEWMEIRLEFSIKRTWRCLQALQRIYWHSWHIFVTSWHLGTWRYPSDRPGSERKRVPLWLRMEHNKLEDWICLQNQDCFLLPPPKKYI